MPADGEVQEVIEGSAGPIDCKGADADKPPENLSYFQVDQVGRVQRFSGIEKPVGES